MGRVHPAVDIIARTEGLWQDDKRIAFDRAKLVVQRLIETGHLLGRMACDVPLVADVDRQGSGGGSDKGSE